MRKLIVIYALSLLGAATAHGKTTYFTGSYDSWGSTYNWDNGIPGSSDTAIIDNNGWAVITNPYSRANTLILGNTTNNSGAVIISSNSGKLYVDYAVIGYGGKGEFYHLYGYHSANEQIQMAYYSTSEASYFLGDTAVLEADSFIAGIYGDAEVTHYGNATIATGLGIGCYSGSNSKYALQGGTLTCHDLSIGLYGNGSFIHANGDNFITNDMVLGYYSNSSGSYELGGTGNLVTGNFAIIGAKGNGTFIHTNGSHIVNTDLVLGWDSGSIGSYELSNNGVLSVVSDSVIGRNGIATFTQTGGTHTVTKDLIFAYGSESEGTYKLNSGTLNVSGNIVSGEGNSTLILDGGTLNLGGTSIQVGQLNVGYTTGTDVTYGIDGAEITANDMTVGEQGKGTFLHVSGTTSITNKLILGNQQGSEGTYTISEGQLSSSRITIGQGGTGQFTQDGGSVTSEDMYIGANEYDETASTGTGTYTLNNGTLETQYALIGGGFGSGNGNFIHNGGTHTSQGLIVGYGSDGYGDYTMNGGILNINGYGSLHVGFGIPSCFNQNGGTVNILPTNEESTASLFIGQMGGAGAYFLQDGQLFAKDIYLGITSDMDEESLQTYGLFFIGGGYVSTSRLYIAYSAPSSFGDATAEEVIAASHGEVLIANSSYVEITEKLYIGPNGKITTHGYSTIHMTGSAFENESTTPENLADLARMAFVFEGGIDDIDPFEVAGQDMGAVLEGFDLNFALGVLVIGGEDIGQLQLVDSFDNQPDKEESEALYVGNLILGAGSMLDLNGLTLYYRNFTDLGGTINLNGGSMIQIPEPSLIGLLALGSLSLLPRRKK